MSGRDERADRGSLGLATRMRYRGGMDSEATSVPRRRARSGAVTLKDVALRAGVAPITVSRALSAPNSVSAPLREQIEAAVAALGYVRNQYAGALASAASRIVPLVVPSLSNVVFIEVIQGVSDVLEAAGYQILLANTQYDLNRERRLVSTLLGWSPAGLLVAGLRHAPQTRALLRDCGRPVVELMELAQHPGDRPVDRNVGLSHRDAGAAMGEHLVSSGYRRIGFVGTRLNTDYRAAQRFEGLDGVLERHGLPRRPPFTGDARSRESRTSPGMGGELLLRALAEAPELDALFFANDDLATGAILRAARENIAVPGRVAIAGFNGLEVGGLLQPSLTTIVSPRRLIGTEAAAVLLRRIEGKDAPSRVDVGFELRIGEST